MNTKAIQEQKLKIEDLKEVLYYVNGKLIKIEAHHEEAEKTGTVLEFIEKFQEEKRTLMKLENLLMNKLQNALDKLTELER